MSKVRVLKQPDNSVAVIIPAPKSKRPEETEEQWLARVFAKATPKDAEFKDVDDKELPATREDRCAWVFDNVKGAKVDEVKAAALRQAKLEAEL